MNMRENLFELYPRAKNGPFVFQFVFRFYQKIEKYRWKDPFFEVLHSL